MIKKNYYDKFGITLVSECWVIFKFWTKYVLAQDQDSEHTRVKIRGVKSNAPSKTKPPMS